MPLQTTPDPPPGDPAELGLTSRGVRCAAWHLPATSTELAGPGGRPCVVMAHGFGATRDTGLLPFARRFAAAGADVVVFDYRGFGASAGTPRQHVSHRRHRQDYHAALARARALPGVDPGRVVLWGSSYSGGHVLAVAARDTRVAGVISQGAAVDGLAATGEIVRYAGLRQLLRLTGHALLDQVGALAGREPHLIGVVGPPGALAAITAPGSVAGYGRITGPSFRNEMCARGVLGIPVNRPVRVAGRLRGRPVLMVVATRDNIAPPAAVRRVVARADARVAEFDCGHFDVYVDEVFESSVAVQVDFLRTAVGRVAA